MYQYATAHTTGVEEPSVVDLMTTSNSLEVGNISPGAPSGESKYGIHKFLSLLLMRKTKEREKNCNVKQIYKGRKLMQSLITSLATWTENGK